MRYQLNNGLGTWPINNCCNAEHSPFCTCPALHRWGWTQCRCYTACLRPVLEWILDIQKWIQHKSVQISNLHWNGSWRTMTFIMQFPIHISVLWASQSQNDRNIGEESSSKLVFQCNHFLYHNAAIFYSPSTIMSKQYQFVHWASCYHADYTTSQQEDHHNVG